ncbi:MAG: DUF3108 domain-containing protein [Chitinophagaceae bacterium]|nr:DUF3108 domain-containing protein [Chitinophagaceae bacterium]
MGTKGSIFTFLCICLHIGTHSEKSNFCGIKNESSSSGEILNYKVFYSLAGAYIGAGEATFSNNLETFQQKTVYHFTGFGKTYSTYDWIYKVRDTYESFVDTSSMLPLKFSRQVNETGNHIFNNVLFNQTTNHAVSTNGVFNIPPCIQDVLSAIYYARNLDFSKAKNGDIFPFSIYLDDHVYPVYIRYMGKANLKTKYGNFNTIKFKPKLIEGTLFKGGEQMTVYVTDDANKIPVFVETPILVGSIKVFLSEFKNNRNKTTGIISMKR